MSQGESAQMAARGCHSGAGAPPGADHSHADQDN